MTIIASMLWRRLDSPGHDTCSLERDDAGWSVRGAASYRHEDGPAWLSYVVQCDDQWRSRCGHVRGAIGNRSIDFVVARRGRSWTLNGSPRPDIDHLLDLDLSFTPATNLLQLRRVTIEPGQSVRLPVAWLDLDAGTLTELPQTYERRGDRTLWYEAPSVGYEGLLELDPNGFIRRYPNLWEAESG